MINDFTLEFIDDSLVDFLILGLLVREALAFAVETFDLLVNELEAIIDGKILRDVVNNKIEAPLEDPGRCEESWPGLNGVVESFGLGTHEETRVTANLAEIRVTHLGLDDRVYEV